MKLKYTWQEDVAKENRGFTEDLLTAYVDGQEVGYLRTCYIPQARFEQFYPTFWHYLRQICGWCFNLEDGDWGILDAINRYMYRNIHLPSPDERPDEIPENFKKIIAEATEDIKNRKKQEWINFTSYQIDTPYIAFVRVHEPWRRQHICVKMHMEVAKRLKKKGLRLHSADTMSDEMKLALKYMAEKYPNILKRRQVKGYRPKKYRYVFDV